VNPLHWRRLYDALFPKRQKRGLTILTRNGRIVKAHDSATGLRPEWKSLDASDLDWLARTLYEMERPDWVEVLDVATLRDYGVAIQTMHDWRETSDTYLARCFRAISHFPGGLVRYPPWPNELAIAGIEVAALRRLVNRVPDCQTLVLAVFDEDEIWACVICRVVGGQIVLITSLDAFLPDIARWPHWQETHNDFLERIETTLGKPHLAFLCSRSAFEASVAADCKMELLSDRVRRNQAIVYPSTDMLFGRD
jgi:hypothetical protein